MPQTTWQALFENALEAMLLAKLDGSIVAANPAACRMFGRTEEELRALGSMDGSFMELVERWRRDGHARGHATLRRSDGTAFTADMSGVAFDELVHIMLIDVTEQLRTHKALEILATAGRVLGESLDTKATMQHLAAVTVPAIADICTVDVVEGGEVQRTAVAHRDPSQIELVRAVRGRDPSAGTYHVIQTGKPQLVKKVTDDFQRQNTRDEEHFVQSKKLGVTSFVSVPLVARGNVLGAFTLASTGGVSAYDEYDLALATALADQAALALDNARTHDAAVKATRLRDQVLEIVSHDLKNPLNTIKLSAGSLARRSDAEEIPLMRRAVERAERLIQDLLDASKMDFTTIPLERAPTSLRAIVDSVLALHRPAAEAKSLALTALVEGVSDTVVVDRHRVVQLLDNLVGNAVKFTPDRQSIEVRARVTSSVVVLEVRDTGIGIEPEVVPHVFDRFWQSARAGRASAGLGLAIARGIAHAHGGDLTVESVLGQGTTFIATLSIA